MFKTFIFTILCCLASILTGQESHAQAQQGFETRPTTTATTRSVPATTPVPPRDPLIPGDDRLVLLIRSTVVAFNQANQTGNYSVLRDLGTPTFQTTNNTAKLAEIFATMRSRKLDLSPIMFYSPKLLTPPAMQEGQILRLTGFFPTTPEQVNFDLAFQQISDQWMLSGIAIGTVPATEMTRAAHGTAYTLQVPAAGHKGMPETALMTQETHPTPTNDVKSVRIDLTDTTALPPRKPTEKKSAKPRQTVTQTTQTQTQPADTTQPQATETVPADGDGQTNQTSPGRNEWQPH